MSKYTHTGSTLFRLMVKRNNKWEDRSVNQVFEDSMVKMFKIVPPGIGSIIVLECKYEVMRISYEGEVICFWVRMADFNTF